jgi:predicted glycoside hydrolase/deacetylase ChbG (UPF0249 family)
MHLTRRDLLIGTAATLAGHVLRGVPRAAPPRLIVRVDDMGYTHAGNEAIVRTVRDGIASSVEVIAPSPWFPEAVRMLADIPQVDVGVHLALTSEWDLVKWRPLTEARSLRDADGYFHPMLMRNPNYPSRALVEQPWKIEDVEREFRAQIELAKTHVPRLSHWSAHMGCTNLSPGVSALAHSLGREYGIDIIPAERGVRNVSYVGARTTSDEKIESMLRMLDSLEADRTYMMVDHPGLDGAELRAVHHVGYENVAIDRQGVTDSFTSTLVRARIRERGIQLIGYWDLASP